MIDSAIFFCFLTAAFLLGSQCRGMFEEKTGKTVKGIAAFAAAILFLACLPSVKTSAPIQVAENLRSGKIQVYAEQWHEIFDMLSMRPGENNVIEFQPDPCVGGGGQSRRCAGSRDKLPPGALFRKRQRSWTPGMRTPTACQMRESVPKRVSDNRKKGKSLKKGLHCTGERAIIN